jgi:hypothetical protein
VVGLRLVRWLNRAHRSGIPGTHNGRERREPVWIGRYRIVSKDSARVLGKAWTERNRAPEGCLTGSEPEGARRRLLASEVATAEASEGMTFS